MEKRKVTLVLVLLMVVVIGIVAVLKAQSDTFLIETYKALDKKDFEIQSTACEAKDITSSVEQIYCGVQRDKALTYFEQLRTKGLNLKLEAVKYNDIKILKHGWSAAVLLVDTKYCGNFVKAGKDEIMGKLAVNVLYQVELARDGRDWKIADVVVLEQK